jgi:predicted ferric reductase
MLAAVARFTRSLLLVLAIVGTVLILTAPSAHAATGDAPAPGPDVTIPVAPLGVLTLLAFFAPYAIGAVNGALPFVTKPWQKKLVSIAVSLLLAAVVMVFYYALTGAPIDSWWTFVLLAIGVVQISYGLVTKSSAKAVERSATSDTII